MWYTYKLQKRTCMAFSLSKKAAPAVHSAFRDTEISGMSGPPGSQRISTEVPLL